MKHLNKTILFTLCCSFLICITGCEDELEVEVPSNIVFGQFPTNGQEARALLQGAYIEFKEDYNSTYYHEDRGDGFEVGVIGSVSNAWNHDITSTNGESWTEFYGALNNINFLLSVADDLSFSNESDRNQLKA